jgi:hypothetical protein
MITLNCRTYAPDEFTIFNESLHFYKTHPNILNPCQGWYEDIALNDKFLFIQVPKTGSSAINKSLWHYKNKKLMTYVPYHKHIGLPFIESEFILPENHPIFAMCRNPFSQVLSVFLHLYSRGDLAIHDYNCWPINIISCFEQWCIGNMSHPMVRQSSLIKSNHSRTIKIFKQENGSPKLLEYLNKSFNISLGNWTVNETNVKKYVPSLKDFYRDKEIIDRVISSRHEEFNDFEYSTDINKI